MVKNVKKLAILFLTLLLLIIIPSSFASDNNASVIEADNNIISNNGEIDVSNINYDGVIYESASDSQNVISASNNIYFNSSASFDGDGTAENPYQKLTAARLTSGCTAYFANGVYELNVKKGVYSSITLIGESAQNTMIKFNGLAFEVDDYYTFTLKDITLDYAVVRNYGTLIADNVIFKNGVANSIDNYNNAYGGAIFNYAKQDYNGMYTNSPKCSLDNCTFLNNSAMYGGAVYINYGDLSLNNCKFINNSANWYGGALACEDQCAVSISNSIFEDCNSIDDAGGAIYSIYSNLKVTNTNFTKCNGNFAGAICSLNSELIVEYSNFINNLARYEGGAIYKMYGSMSIKKSEFNGNAALNGGAVFSDNCTYFEIKDSEFSSNEASGFGGAIFSNANPKFTLDNVVFTNNKANYNSNVLNQTKFSPIISSGNDYPLFTYKSEFNGTLPARYNLAENGYTTDIRDQQASGNCWAFAALASLESCVLKASNKTFDFSVENMKNLIEKYSAFGWNMETNNGGFNEMSIGYLTSWLGPVNLTLDKFDDKGTLSPIFDSEIHVQNVYMLPARTSYTDNDAIKEAILKYGAVYASYYHSSYYLNGYNYYCSMSTSANHAIAVVGWDDNYSRNNFGYSNRPAGDGAFIVKNSWGSSWGNKGYFYISYYDKVLFKLNSKDEGFTFILNDTVRYNKNYQYDIIGMTDYFVTGKDTIWYQNVYHATSAELIAAFSTYFNTTVDYEANIYVNGQLKLTQSGTHEGSGYYTIPLKEYVPVSIGDEFKVSIKLFNPRAGYAVFPISEVTSSYYSAVRCYYAPGVSYFSFDGKKWNDLYNYTFSGFNHSYISQVACLKVFAISTKANTTITLNDVDMVADDLTEIIATVIDSNGLFVKTGEVSFDIGGKSYTVNVANGIAKLNVILDAGNYRITASYIGNSLYNSSVISKNVNVAKNNVNLTLDIDNIVYGENLIVNINLTSITGKKLSDEVSLKVNDKKYSVKIINGSASFIISDNLDVGVYLAIVSYLSNNNYNGAEDSINFTINNRNITMDVITEANYKDLKVNIILSEKINGTLKAYLNNQEYLISYVDGIGSYIFKDLDYGEYSLNITFSKDNYETVDVVKHFEITPVATILETNNFTMYYHDGTKLTAKLTDCIGNPIANETIFFIINGVTYNRTTDADGIASMAINLIPGNYNVTVYYKGSDKYNNVSKNVNITIISTIYAENLVKMFQNGTQFFANFTDIDGKPLANTNVTFNINGVFYTRETNANGTARLNINLEPGKYILTVINPANDEQKGFNITVKSLVEANDLIKYYKNASAFEAKIYDKNGVLATNKNVTFNINGVFYNKVTDENGIAKLNINLRPGKYIITTYYEGLAIGNNVEVLPTLITSDLNMNYKDGSKFNATVLDGRGNPLVNQKVTFNVNGVFYYKTTNLDGIASLNINLMQGKYIITSEWDGYQTGNNIIIA